MFLQIDILHIQVDCNYVILNGLHHNLALGSLLYKLFALSDPRTIQLG